jgi:hypothetical protein
VTVPRIHKRFAIIWAVAFVAAASIGAGIGTSVAGNAGSGNALTPKRSQALVPPVVENGISSVRQSAAKLEGIVTGALGEQSYIESVVVAQRSHLKTYLGSDAYLMPSDSTGGVVWIIKAHGLVRGIGSTQLGAAPPDAEHDVYYTFDDATGQNESFGLLDVPR